MIDKPGPPDPAGERPTRSPASADSQDIDLTVLVLADGAKPDILRALSASGDLPNIKRYFMDEGSCLEGVTVLPSVTDVAYLPMLTGQYPGTANMPGIRWVDKSRFTAGRLFVKGHRSYVGPAHLNFNGDMPESLETLFELCPGSLAVRSDIHRGLSAGRNPFHGMSIPFMFFSHYFKRADFVDKIVLKVLFRAMRRMNDDLPCFVFVPLLDIDTASHARGPTHRKTIEAHRRVDGAVGAIIARLKRLGIWDRTHLLITSDHGHTETIVHLDLSTLLSELDYNVFEHPNLYRPRADAAVMVSGNSFANVYVSTEGRWEKPSTDDDLERKHRRLLETLSLRPEVEWVAYRHHDGGVKIVSDSGTALMSRQDGSYIYDSDGSDPLELGLPQARVGESDALKMTAETRFPDALEQLWHLFTSQRTGDIVVTSKPGYDLRGRREQPEHHSSHGALCEEHMRVPVMSNRKIASNGPVRTVDIFPTVIESLGRTATKPHFGRSLL